MLWALIAVVVITVGGIALHFAFQASRQNRVVAVVAPVNESVWEHLKMPYLPSVAMACAQAAVTPSATATLLTAYGLGYYLNAAALIALSRLAGDRESAAAHAAVFVTAVILGQAAVAGLIAVDATANSVATGLALLAAPGIVFAVTTFRPPHLSLFRDPLTNHYGLPNHC